VTPNRIKGMEVAQTKEINENRSTAGEPFMLRKKGSAPLDPTRRFHSRAGKWRSACQLLLANGGL
jgi:hypothetical protein